MGVGGGQKGGGGDRQCEDGGQTGLNKSEVLRACKETGFRGGGGGGG